MVKLGENMKFETVNKMFEDYLKEYLTMIGYKNLEYHNTVRNFDGEKKLLFSEKESLLRKIIFRLIEEDGKDMEFATKSELLLYFLNIFCKYFEIDFKPNGMLSSYPFNIDLIEGLDENNPCLAQYFYKKFEKHIVEPKFIYMNTIVLLDESE